MINELQVIHLRNLSGIHLQLSRCNVFVGKNGSGKTSLLEAVFLLSRGKSFRHHEPKRYISHPQKSCTVWAKTTTSTVAIQKTLDEKNLASTILRMNNVGAPSQSTISYTLPVLLIDPSGMDVLENGSSQRRQLLDWLAFHVKPGFYEAWLGYQRLLKQRNALLKSIYTNRCLAELTAWDRELSRCASLLHEYRWEVFLAWRNIFNDISGRLLPRYKERVFLSYQAGFDHQIGLFECLQGRLTSDIELGYTRVGAHRCDITISTHHDDLKSKEQAVNILSRGEKKLLIAALRLSQLLLICRHESQNTPVVLIDDVDSELDEWAVDLLIDKVLPLPCQLIITSLQETTSDKIKNKLAKLGMSEQFASFAISQGSVTQK